MVKKTMYVRYKNYDGNYEAESKLKYSIINADKFNPVYHRKLFWRNFFQSCSEYFDGKGKDFFNNPWVVGVGTAVIAGIILFFLLS